MSARPCDKGAGAKGAPCDGGQAGGDPLGVGGIGGAGSPGGSGSRTAGDHWHHSMGPGNT